MLRFKSHSCILEEWQETGFPLGGIASLSCLALTDETESPLLEDSLVKACLSTSSELIMSILFSFYKLHYIYVRLQLRTYTHFYLEILHKLRPCGVRIDWKTSNTFTTSSQLSINTLLQIFLASQVFSLVNLKIENNFTWNIAFLTVCHTYWLTNWVLFNKNCLSTSSYVVLNEHSFCISRWTYKQTLDLNIL